MIVRDAGGDVLLVTQPEHARLARRIMAQWPPLAAEPRRDEILLAIGHHDAGWADADAAPSVDRGTGDIVDFVGAPLAVRQGGAPRAMAGLAHEPWAAALVAQHGLTVYGRFRGTPEWEAYFAARAQERENLLRQCARSSTMLTADYTFLRLADLISLAFCTGWTREETHDRWTVACEGTHVCVTPADAGLSIPIAVEATRLARQRFTSDAHLADAIARGTPVTLDGTLSA